MNTGRQWNLTDIQKWFHSKIAPQIHIFLKRRNFYGTYVRSQSEWIHLKTYRSCKGLFQLQQKKLENSSRRKIESLQILGIKKHNTLKSQLAKKKSQGKLENIFRQVKLKNKYQNLWDTVQSMLLGKFIDSNNAYIWKEERSQIDNLNLEFLTRNKRTS